MSTFSWVEHDKLLSEIAKAGPNLHEVCEALGVSRANVVQHFRAFYKAQGLSGRAAAKLLDVTHTYLLRVEAGVHDSSEKMIKNMLYFITTKY